MKGRVRNILWVGLGLLFGVALGLFLGWVAWPTEFTEADPTILEESYQRDYTLMIAATYSLDGDLAGARRRLSHLGKEDINGWVLDQAVDYILENGDETEIRQLVLLAHDMGLSSPAMTPYLPAADGDSS
ncbi:MAG: hypothetical protein WAM60_16310 [Candidatus Promineifilaceae bacterium]